METLRWPCGTYGGAAGTFKGFPPRFALLRLACSINLRHSHMKWMRERPQVYLAAPMRGPSDSLVEQGGSLQSLVLASRYHCSFATAPPSRE